MVATMRAVTIGEPGGPEVLGLRRVERPVPGPEEVLVRVAASGVNRADLLQRRGRYPAPPGAPEEIPGLEFAGRVEESGAGCRLRAPGDRVMGVVGGGGYAGYLTVHERATVRIPDGMSDVEAGGVPEVFMTAFDALLLQAGLGAGETVLIHAVGSGVGTAALQLAGAVGARTVGTSRTPGKLERARALGLDEAVVSEGGDPDEGGWPETVLERTGGRGVDVILDLVGAAYAGGNVRCLAGGARWIVVGVPSGARAELDLRRLMASRASVRGTVLRARPLEEKIALARRFEERVVPLFEAGRIRAVVDRVLAPEEASEAHRLMEENRTFGKLVLGWDRPI